MSGLRYRLLLRSRFRRGLLPGGGITANSFTSLSLDPPLVLWCLSKAAPSRRAFERARYFAVNVLCAEQHELSRQFSTPADDKFTGVPILEGPGGVPMIDGVLAHFVVGRLPRPERVL